MKLHAPQVLLESGWAEDKTLDIEGGLILSIVDGKSDGAESLNGAVIPGMANLHSHSFQKAFVGLTEFRTRDDDSFWSWREAMYRLLKTITPDDLHIIARYLYQEMLLNGYTSCAEFHYLHHPSDAVSFDEVGSMSNAVIEAALETGIDLTHCPVFYHYSGFGELPALDNQRPFLHSMNDFQHLLEVLQKRYQNNAAVAFGIAPHSLRAVSSEQLKELENWWTQGPIHIHIAEQMPEVNACMEFYGQRPVEWLLQNHSVNERWCLVHATHLTESEVMQLANSGAVAGICPETEANLGDGIFPAEAYIAQNGKFGIGSDSQICVSPFRELRTFEYSQRLVSQKRNRLCSQREQHVGTFLWQNSVKNGAEVVRPNAGALKEGSEASFIVLDNQIAELCHDSMEYFLDSAIFAANENPVRDVYVRGICRVKDKELQGQNDYREDYRRWLKKTINEL
ncbi:MAG: formimidoylglutamate deiminase [Gammaproteobacteria bacterium]|nr:formimidoylglutamate deiminase [Gammaproteobacteria bacterium]